QTFVSRPGGPQNGSFYAPEFVNPWSHSRQCIYTFLAVPGQRVEVVFTSFALRGTPPDCIHEYMDVYSEVSQPDPSELINSPFGGRYCGPIPPRRRISLYRAIALAFYTDKNISTSDLFSGRYQFINDYFISKNDGEHIRGSECDQKILSKKESTGFVFSPNYPFPYIPKLVCRYFIYGMQDAQHLERVRLEFLRFEIPKGKKGDCSDGYLKIYLKGQETTDSYDKFDYEMCGDEIKPSVVVSDGPRLVMVFSSGELMGRGFKANYTFETEYRIPGTAAPDGTCTFTYRSTSRKRGEFNSPRYPSNYPSDTNCTYLFLATPNEQVILVFDNFKVRADSTNSSIGSYGAIVCQEDWLEIFNVYRDGTEKLIGRYCGMSAPGPIESNRGALGLKLLLHADSEGVYSGFKARYNFETAKPIFGECGSNVSSTEYGVITSPNFPDNYDGPSKGLSAKTCNWYISVRPKYKILLDFERFAIEGDPGTRGCPAAVLRLWINLSGTPIELCGEKGSVEKLQYVSESNAIRFSFITADKAVGSQGFRIIWTEIQEGPSCDEFQCSKTGYCIPNKLRCDLVKNCGAEDDSDEADCKVEVPKEDHTRLIAGIVAAVIIVLTMLFFLCHRKRRRRRRGANNGGGLHRPFQLPVPPGSSRRTPQHVCEELGERFASVDSV
ncbi:CUB domain-containing protein, partial [Oryctes borbonicus]